VRRDLPWSQRAVQASHAAVNLVFHRRSALDECEWGEHGPSFVFYGVDSETELLALESALGADASSFREPDLGNRLTAVAYLGFSRPEFGRYDLL
jgi:hypothetical protein